MFVAKVKKAVNHLKFKLKEKTFRGELKYLFEDNNSDSLVIVFSGFGGIIKKYNYVKTLKNVKINKLFILDVWGFKGSYYWYDRGSSHPIGLVQELIEMILSKHQYKNIYTAGSSKGGTCAIYYGLMYGATILAGSCQYHIGDYLGVPHHAQILESMMGNCNHEGKNILNNMMPSQIEKYKDSTSIVHFLVSKEDPTYNLHIVDLKKKLEDVGIHYTETIEHFSNHDDVGIFFGPFLYNFFK